MGIAYCESVVVTVVTALVRIRPRNVCAASKVIGKCRGHTDGGLASAIWPEFIRIPRGYRNRFPRVEGRQAVTGEVGLIQSDVENLFVSREVT